MSPLIILLLLAVLCRADTEFKSGDVVHKTDKWWEDETGRIVQITSSNYHELIVENPDQIWLVMLAKKRNDLCLRALGVYQILAKKLPEVRFGYINVLEDEALKVAFREEAVPFSFAIFGGRAYRYYALERDDEMEEYFKNPERWKKMKHQFDVPQRPANWLEIKWFDIKKETRRTIVPLNRAYMEWFHKMRTGSKRNFEDSTALGFTCLGVAVFIVLIILVCVCRALCCHKPKTQMAAKTGEKED